MELSKDIIGTLTPKQKAELFQQRAIRVLSEKRRVPWLPDPVEWITRYFYIPELKGPMTLEPYQVAALRESQRKDKNGNLVYSTVVWSDIKKSAKSCIAAAMALWKAWGIEWGSISLIANDLKGAESRVGYYMRRAIELHPDIKPIVKIRNSGYRMDFPNRTFIEAIAIDPSGEAGSNCDMIVFSELWGAHEDAKQKMWCLDDKTEVLTNEGFKLGIELTTDDWVAVYNESGEVKWERPRYVFCEQYSGPMHLYQNRQFNMLCTPDHRLYDANLGVIRSNELETAYTPVMTIGHIDPIDYPSVYLPPTKFKEEKYILWEDWATFLGLYLTEGYTADFRGVPCNVRISQLEKPHPEKYALIGKLLTDIFGDWVKTNGKDGYKISSTSLAAITKPLGKTWEKRIPRAIIHSPKHVLRRFLDAYILGDGHLCENGRVVITCATYEMASDLQEVALRLGYRTSIRTQGAYWRIRLMPPTQQVVIPNKVETQYTGKVWCPSVSTGLFVARRNGIVFITGNTEMTIPPNKHGKAQRWVETYAGYVGKSPLLEQLYEAGVKKGRRLKLKGAPDDLEIYANDAAQLLVLWNTKPRHEWQTPEYYAEEAAVLAPTEFLRVHRNQWVSTTTAFIPGEWWDACKGEVPALRRNEPMIFGVDAGVTNDCFAIVGVSKRGSQIYTRYCRVWYPPKGRKIDFAGPEAEIRRLAKEYNVIEWAYDQYQLHDMATRLSKDGCGWFNVFSQAQDRMVADKHLYDLIRDRRITHSGYPDLDEHIKNADAETDKERMRIVKRSESLKIDAAVALSMAAKEAARLNIG